MIELLIFICIGFILFLIVRRWLTQHQARFWLQKSGNATGPFSLRNLGQLWDNKDIGADDRVRVGPQGEFKPFVICLGDPPRLRQGVVGGIIGLAVGLYLGICIADMATGKWVQVEDLFSKPRKSKLRNVGDAAVRIGEAGSQKSRIPGVAEAGGAIGEGYRMLQEESDYDQLSKAIDIARIVTLVTLVGMITLFVVRARKPVQLMLSGETTPYGHRAREDLYLFIAVLGFFTLLYLLQVVHA